MARQETNIMKSGYMDIQDSEILHKKKRNMTLQNMLFSGVNWRFESMG